MTLTEWLDELERVEKAATPGPFFIERRDDSDGYFTFIVHGGKDFAWCKEDLDKHARWNADFIATSRNAIPKLISMLREALKAIERASVCGCNRRRFEGHDPLSCSACFVREAFWRMEGMCEEDVRLKE